MKSGKQILLWLLSQYSQKFINRDEIENISNRIKAGLLLHGSSSEEMFEIVEKTTWITKDLIHIEKNNVENNLGHYRQGLGLKKYNLLLEELFELIIDENKIPKGLKKECPGITLDDYQAGIHLIKLLLLAVEWNKTNNDIEKETPDTKIAEKLINVYINQLKLYRDDNNFK